MNKKFMGLMALVAGVAITTFSVSGTYAKYTSTVNGTENTARVAKWGFNSDGGASIEYNIFDTNGKFTHVKAGENLIAPGTRGMIDLSLTSTALQNFGESEVDYDITPTVSLTDGTKSLKFWIDDQNNNKEAYSAVKDSETIYTIDNFDGTQDSSLKDAIISAMTNKAGIITVEAGSTPSVPVSSDGKVYLHWEWVYDDTTGLDSNVDSADTEKGTNASKGTEIKATFKVDLTATQTLPVQN